MHFSVAKRIVGKIERTVPERAGPRQPLSPLDLPVKPAIGLIEARIRRGRRQRQPVFAALQPCQNLIELHPHFGHRTAFHMRAEKLRQADRRQPEGHEGRKRSGQRKAQTQAHACSKK